MINCLTYSVVERKNPRFPDKEGKYYAQIQSQSVLDNKELIKRLDKGCIVGKPDIVSVLITLEEVVAQALCNGEIVRIGELGSLSLSVSSDGCQRLEEFKSKNITKVRVIFREGRTLKNEIACMKFKKVEQKFTSI